MALHLHTCGDLSLGHDALWVVVRPWEKKKSCTTRRAVVRAQTSLGNELANEAMWQVSLSDRFTEWTVNSAAAPRYSSLPRLGGWRRYEAKMETRDTVLTSIADWVFLRVKDPLVEVDPITVNRVILKEQEAEGITEGDGTVASTSASGIFAYLLPGFPRGAKGAALLAGIVLLIAALGTAAIIALRRKETSGALPPELEGIGSAQNGGAREDLDGGSTELRDENKSSPSTENGDGVIKRPPLVTPTSFQGFHPPVSPPSSVAFRGDGAHSHPTSKDGSENPHSETDVTLVMPEEIISSSSNGSPLEHSVKEEVVASVVLIEEISTEKFSERPEALNGEERILSGDSESLTTVPKLAPPATSQEALESILFEGPDCQPSIEANDAEIDAEAVDERRKEYTEMLKKVLPAVSVGAGAAALSTLSGVDGALQMVGLLATASFITRDIMWAGQRKQLVDELCNIKDHKQFIEFLKGRNIIPDGWTQ